MYRSVKFNPKNLKKKVLHHTRLHFGTYSFIYFYQRLLLLLLLALSLDSEEETIQSLIIDLPPVTSLMASKPKHRGTSLTSATKQE